MFDIKYAFELMHGYKSTVLKSIVMDETYRKPLQKMVDAELEFTKVIATNVEEALTKFKAFA